MSRVSPLASALLFFSLLSSLGQQSLADDGKAVQASGRRIAMSVPHSKADKVSSGGKLHPGTSMPGAMTTAHGQDNDWAISPVRKFVRDSSQAIEQARTTNWRQAVEIIVWVSTVFRAGPPIVTPVAVPKISHKDFMQIPAPTALDRMRQYVSPQGQIRTVVGR